MEENLLLFFIAFIRIWETGFPPLDRERALLAFSKANCRCGQQQNEVLEHFHYPKQCPLQAVLCPLPLA